MPAIKSSKHILFDEKQVKWFWTEVELKKFREMWNAGDHIQTIAHEFKTNKRSIVLLVLDQAEDRMIDQRKMGLFGSEDR